MCSHALLEDMSVLAVWAPPHRYVGWPQLWHEVMWQLWC